MRSGNVAAPDGSWSSFVPVSAGAFNLTGRYLQYRATLQTTDSGLSPTLRSVTLSYGAAPVDNTPPTITARTPLDYATNVPIGSSVSATFSEPMDAATITAASVTLRATGAGSDVPATVNYAAGVASLVPDAPLAYNTVYTATVRASAPTWRQPAGHGCHLELYHRGRSAQHPDRHQPGRLRGWHRSATPTWPTSRAAR